MVIVVTWNLEYGAEAYGSHRAVEMISRSGAQILLLQEVYPSNCKSLNVAQTIGDDLSWHVTTFSRSGTAIVSSSCMEVVTEGEHFGICKIDDIYYCVIHFSDYPYIPSEASGIPYPAECAASSEQPCFRSSDPITLQDRSFKARQPDFDQLRAALNLIPCDAQIVIGGDFNEPSHRDWTVKQVDDGCAPLVVEFPTTRLLEHLGFVDAYRHAHRDVTKFPGYTWPDRPVEYEHRRDRIDFIFVKNLRVSSSRVFCTKLSDHAMVRAVVTSKNPTMHDTHP